MAKPKANLWINVAALLFGPMFLYVLGSLVLEASGYKGDYALRAMFVSSLVFGLIFIWRLPIHWGAKLILLVVYPPSMATAISFTLLFLACLQGNCI